MADDLDPPFDPSTLMTNGKLARILAPAAPIFPCYEEGEKMKSPYHGVPWKSARAGQVDRVEKWWADHPDAMPGLHLGELGLLVVDADGPKGVAAWEAISLEHGGVPECPMVDTPSEGRHYYFRQRPGRKLGNGRGALPPKDKAPIDIRGDGGFVIAPDAMREDGIYWPIDMDALAVIQSAPEIPDWLFDLLTAREISDEPLPVQDLRENDGPEEITSAPVIGIPTSVTSANRMQPSRPLDMSHPRLRAWVESAFKEEVQALATCAKGGRNEQLNRSAFAIYQLVAAGWIKDSAAHTALVEAAEACGLMKDGRRGVLKTIASGRRGGMAQPRAVPEEFFRDEELADQARALVALEDGTLHDAETGEVIEPKAQVNDEFPEHLTRVPGLVGELTDWITSTAIYPNRMLALGAALTLVGTAMGRNWCGPTGSSTVLYVMALAPTGAGKDHGIQAIRRILKVADMKRLVGADEFTGGPAIEQQIKRSSLCLCAMDEFGAFMARLLGRKSSSFERQATKTLRTLWGIKYGEFKCQDRAQSEGQMISAPHLSIYGVSVHQELFDALTGADVANGFLNRFLFLATMQKPAAQEHDNILLEPPARLTDALQQVFGAGNEFSQGAIMCAETDIAPRAVEWHSDDAQQRWRDFQKHVERLAERETELEPYLARTAEMAVRLATIMAMGRNKLKPMVSVKDVDWACEVAMWSATAMARACGLYISESQSQADTNRILRIVRDMGGRCTRAMVNRKLRGVLRKRDLDDTWKMIIEAGLLESVGCVKAENGRGVEWFTLKDG